MITPPDLHIGSDDQKYNPSWSASAGYVNQEHTHIFGETKELPGWQAPGDSEKLYEMGYHCGATILEIGVYGGRSATVEIRGALAAWKEHGGCRPQFYGVEIGAKEIHRSLATLTAQNLAEYSLLYQGDLRQFLYDIPIIPTMVFVDGNHRYPGIWADLDCLSRSIASGTPVLCHDYLNTNADVRQVVDEWVDRGAFEFMGISGCSSLLRVSEEPDRPSPCRLSDIVFEQVRTALCRRYNDATESPMHVDVADLTEQARIDLGMTSPLPLPTVDKV